MKSRRKGEKDKDDGGRAKGAAQLRGDQDTEEVCGTRGYSAFCLSFIREALHGNAAAELPTTANFSTMLVTLCCIRKHPTPEILVFSVVAKKVYRVCKRLNRHWQQEASGHPTKVLPKSPIPKYSVSKFEHSCSYFLTMSL
ncbi:hypothetical protein HZH68_012236 [Vespula germanica]|uniref:Uncharacterized protein n=1 Tax=Vespula germanica TaxID=30212 RepID=A0A834MYD5_VESGE|nr:hypothetical protein HZH68_012236 [Vespula germanica]